MVSMRGGASSCDGVRLFKETMETMAITEPLAMKGPKVRKETKETWGHEGSAGSTAPKEKRATRGSHRSCRYVPAASPGGFSIVLGLRVQDRGLRHQPGGHPSLRVLISSVGGLRKLCAVQSALRSFLGSGEMLEG